MRWYADSPALRTRQLVTDAVVLLWIALWCRIALAVHDAVRLLAAPGRQLQKAGTDLADGLGGAAERAGGVPVVGDELREPLDGASGAGRAVARAGTAQVEAVETLALLLALVVLILPVAWVIGRWLPGRLEWGREAAAAERLHADVELLALRAAAHAPLARLARLGPDPVGAWRRGDPGAAEALAALALSELGLRSRGPARAGRHR